MAKSSSPLHSIVMAMGSLAHGHPTNIAVTGDTPDDCIQDAMLIASTLLTMLFSEVTLGIPLGDHVGEQKAVESWIGRLATDAELLKRRN